MNDLALLSNLDRLQRFSLIAGAVGMFICLITALFNRAVAFQAYWFAWVFWVGLALGALSLLMLLFLTGGAWTHAVQRPTEAAATTLPLMAVLLVPALFGLGDIFEWARRGALAEHHWPHKENYLTVGWFIFRALIYFVVTSAIVIALRYSDAIEEDRAEYRGVSAFAGRISGAGIVAYAICVLFASTDWVMSLQPEWYSTMFGVIFAASGFLAALALVTGVITVASRQDGVAGMLSTKQFHDLGNLLLAFVIFWTYVSFSQFLLIWSGNLPQEISWYLRRRSGGWEYVVIALALLQFAIPFALLLSRAAKRHPKRLGPIAWLVFGTSVLNVYWQVVPAFRHGAAHALWLYTAAFIGVGGFWTAAFIWLLKQRPLWSAPVMRPEVQHG